MFGSLVLNRIQQYFVSPNNQNFSNRVKRKFVVKNAQQTTVYGIHFI